ncbi:MAG: mechanosensitive ion channel [Verrucomicrobia bacterium]|nr:mechanosensitive ion channel [Verrucomicrobiota bacterium]
MQSTISIGVVYGSPIRKVTHYLLEVADEHGLVLKKPEPAVTLSEFADKGLVFTLSYWINICETNQTQVASDLRRMIMQQLTENGIALSNMPVQLVEPANTAAGNAQPEKIVEK